jgi:hypothetical protein
MDTSKAQAYIARATAAQLREEVLTLLSPAAYDKLLTCLEAIIRVEDKP